jgi:uncharacterized protein with GYD domain
MAFAYAGSAIRVTLLASCQWDMPAFRETKGSDCDCVGRAMRKSNKEELQMLFCITANYTPKALDAMGKNPNTNRREAVEKLLTAAGGKLVAMYGTIADGPGAMVIFNVDPNTAPAVAGVVTSSDGLRNVEAEHLFSGD